MEKFIVIVLKNYNLYDCVLNNKAYSERHLALAAMDNAREEDKINKLQDVYRYIILRLSE